MNTERPRVLTSLIIPGLLLLAMWVVKSAEALLGLSLVGLGIYPRSVQGLPGILLSPFIHGDWGHLGANSASLFVLTAALFYFYREIALRAFLGIWLITGLWVWMGAREAWHIGASGVIYGNAAFLFVSGLLRRNPRLSALALFVVFAYGSLIWGIFPQFFPGENISWEGH
ncbi:MAG: rhomboid family intramembrane serine protease, partial [Bacteroidales bacterium]|nr:rhomboid family intramembrane serine protease [Bacteroidales bacterium]